MRNIDSISGVQDIHYNDSLLLEQLEVCADTLEKAERFELLGHLYRLIVPMYEEKRNYEALANCYSHLAQACNKIVEVTRTGKRLLGRFYRIAFFGTVRYTLIEYSIHFRIRNVFAYFTPCDNQQSNLSFRRTSRRKPAKNISTRNRK